MANAATLLTKARTDAGLSRKALAARAGVPTSTISRIEDGTNDPTIGMLDRVLAAAGTALDLDLGEPPEGTVASLHDAWRHTARGDQPDWTRIRALADRIALHPDEAADVVRHAAPRTGSDRIDNLLAAIAETIADDHGLHAPKWVAAVPPLSEPWEGAGTPLMRQRQAARAPRRFVARGIYLAAQNVWRDRG